MEFTVGLSEEVGSDVVLGWTTGDDTAQDARQATSGVDYTAQDERQRDDHGRRDGGDAPGGDDAGHDARGRRDVRGDGDWQHAAGRGDHRDRRGDGDDRRRR